MLSVCAFVYTENNVSKCIKKKVNKYFLHLFFVVVQYTFKSLVIWKKFNALPPFAPTRPIQYSVPSEITYFQVNESLSGERSRKTATKRDQDLIQNYSNSEFAWHTLCNVIDKEKTCHGGAVLFFVLFWFCLFMFLLLCGSFSSSVLRPQNIFIHYFVFYSLPRKPTVSVKL